MGFSRQECWGGLPFASLGHLPDLEIEPESPTLANGFFTAELPERYTILLDIEIPGETILCPGGHQIPVRRDTTQSNKTKIELNKNVVVHSLSHA